MIQKILCYLGFHKYGPWDDVMCCHWRVCKHCGHRDEINNSYM